MKRLLRGSGLKKVCLILIVLVFSLSKSDGVPESRNQNHESWPVIAADEMIAANPRYISYENPSLTWNYPQALLLHAIWEVWTATHDRKYFDYVKSSVDFYLPDSGGLRTYVQSDFRLDDLLMGRVILDLYKATGEQKYRDAAAVLRKQIRNQPRTPEGGFWHKMIYPEQMWLDGLYMAEPFYAQYAAAFNEPQDFPDIARQFILMAKHARDPKTGLMYHGWDFSKQEKWADAKTGDSRCFWGRAIGWYMMGLVDVLDYVPEDQPGRERLLSIFKDLCNSVLRYQDRNSHMWYQVVDQPAGRGNYSETSASAMFAYSFAKGARKGYLEEKFLAAAIMAFDRMTSRFVQTTQEKKDGRTHFVLESTSGTAGLGGNPYRDGSYEYYSSIPKESNDFRGVGPFILAALQIEKAKRDSTLTGKGKTIGLDYYFNDEWKKEKNGREYRFHYVWEDTSDSGYSQLAGILSALGARLTSLSTAPTEDDLRKLSVYVIVDPDTRLENPHPNYIDKHSIDAIADWVRRGGVLVLFANDSGNCEFEHLNRLAEKFGIHFNEDSRNDVVQSRYDEGAFAELPASPIFDGVKMIFLKEISTLKISGTAKAELVDKDQIIMASSGFGKGFVFAVGDPWFYNEYMDHRRLPEGFENANAARNLFKWLLQKSAMVSDCPN